MNSLITNFAFAYGTPQHTTFHHIRLTFFDKTAHASALCRFNMPLIRKRRKKRRNKSVLSDMRNRTLFAFVALALLVFIMMLIFPLSERRQIPLGTTLLLGGTLWAVSVFAIWACLRSRRRRYSHTHGDRSTIGTDYSDADDQ